MANPFVHIELSSTDVTRAKTFYGSLFGWKLNDVDMGGGHQYTLIDVGEGIGGGMMSHPVPGAPSSWLAYVNVDDIKQATEKARSLGGNVMREPTEVPGEGWFSVVIDPTGAAFGLWQTKAK
jgi:predicted enzyme related to lactoylglutathione lyase